MTSDELAERQKQKEKEKAMEAFNKPPPVESDRRESFKKAEVEEPIYKPFSMADATR